MQLIKEGIVSNIIPWELASKASSEGRVEACILIKGSSSQDGGRYGVWFFAGNCFFRLRVG